MKADEIDELESLVRKCKEIQVQIRQLRDDSDSIESANAIQLEYEEGATDGFRIYYRAFKGQSYSGIRSKKQFPQLAPFIEAIREIFDRKKRELEQQLEDIKFPSPEPPEPQAWIAEAERKGYLDHDDDEEDEEDVELDNMISEAME